MICSATDCQQPIRWINATDHSLGIEHVDPTIIDHPAFKTTGDAPRRTKAELNALSNAPVTVARRMPKIKAPRRRPTRWKCAKDQTILVSTVWMMKPAEGVGDPRSLVQMPGLKACHVCLAIYNLKGEQGE